MIQPDLFEMGKPIDDIKTRRHGAIDFEERQQIQILLKTNETITGIARLMGRSKNTLVVEVRKNGGRFNYNAEEAQKRRERLFYERTLKNTRAPNDPVKPQKRDVYLKIQLQQQAIEIENVKMQIEILVQEIKKIKGTYDQKNN